MTTGTEISVLVVEDDRFQIEGIVDNLSLEGFKVFGARSAQEAICLLQEAAGRIDLGLLDIDLSGEMNGIDLLQHIRLEWPDMQVVILSGKATLDHAVQALNHGAFSFLYKPCDPEYLMSTLRQAHDRRQLVEQNAHLLRELAHTRNALLVGEAVSIPGGKVLKNRTTAGRLVHEVSNQLMILLNGAERASEREQYSEETRKEFSKLAAVANRATEIIKLARRRLSEIETEPMDILDLSATVETVLEQMNCLLESHGIKTKMETTVSESPIFGCRLRLEQVFVNLILNAIEAMPKGGTLEVTIKHSLLSNSRDEIVVTIEDSGPGIAPNKWKTVFDRNSSGKAEGRGLGLYLARSIVCHHAGTIAVANGAKGGARFELRFPVRTAKVGERRVH